MSRKARIAVTLAASVLVAGGAVGHLVLTIDADQKPLASASSHANGAGSGHAAAPGRAAPVTRLSAPATALHVEGSGPSHLTAAVQVPSERTGAAAAPVFIDAPSAPSRRAPSTKAASPAATPAPRVDSRDNAASREEALENQRLAKSVLADLKDADSRRRIEALRTARDLAVPGVSSEVTRVALEDEDALVRRYAVQTLALDDHCAEYHDTFVNLLTSPDWAIRTNATIGLARAGDESAQSDLLQVALRLRAERSPQADSVFRAVESPELHGQAILEHYRAASVDQLATAQERHAAESILAAKRAQAGLSTAAR